MAHEKSADGAEAGGMRGDGVLVALSGGVDSAVALLRLVAQGRRVEAAIVALWPGDDPRSCCGPAAVARAQAAADAAGVPLHVLDERARFARAVVEPFVRAYLAGETPNPCVRCNPQRLAALVAFAEARGLACVATGHYARLVSADGRPWRPGGGGEPRTDQEHGRGGGPYLARAADRAKDQSYMLAAVPPGLLARLEFPLGGLTKPQVRAAAREAGLACADEPESQEVCFAPNGYRAFLEERGVPPQPGPIVDRRGRVLGEHDGHWNFTVGQRRGLGVAGSEPLYVVERRASTNEVVVGTAHDLLTVTFALRDIVDRGVLDQGALDHSAPDCGAVDERALGRRDPDRDPLRDLVRSSAEPAGGAAGGRGASPAGMGPAGRLHVQLRYRSAAVPVAGFGTSPAGDLLVRLAAPFAAPAPGQAAVFYRDDVVVGVGVIAAAPATGAAHTAAPATGAAPTAGSGVARPGGAGRHEAGPGSGV